MLHTARSLSGLGIAGAGQLPLDTDIDLIGCTVFSDQHEKVGQVEEYVLDESGNLRYLVVDTGFWIFGKKIMVPTGFVDVQQEEDEEVVVLRGLTKEQAHDLPQYNENDLKNETYEQQLMASYYPSAGSGGVLSQEMQAQQGREAWGRGDIQDQPAESQQVRRAAVGQGRMDYNLYQQAFQTPQRLQLIEERLRVSKHAEHVGDVVIRKVTETHTEHLKVPVTEERIVIEHQPVTPGQVPPGGSYAQQMSGGGSSARLAGMANEEPIATIPLYRETLDVEKHPVVGEEVVIRKEAQQRVQSVEEAVSRERLDVQTQGQGLDIQEKN
jgi:stress response protein YsnF